MKYYKKIPRIVRINKKDGFKIICTWNTGEVKEIDFKQLFIKWKVNEHHILFPLTKLKNFKNVELAESRTLCWPSVLIDGHPIDLDPIVLYEAGTRINIPKQNKIGLLLRKARKKAGLSQEQLAIVSGTSKAYLSRVETGKSNIEIDTLERIVETGLGMRLVFSFIPEGSQEIEKV